MMMMMIMTRGKPEPIHKAWTTPIRIEYHKACLAEHMVDFPRKEEIREETVRFVIQVSKWVSKGYVVFSRWLLYCLENELELPDLKKQGAYLQCTNIDCGNRAVKPLPHLCLV